MKDFHWSCTMLSQSHVVMEKCLWLWGWHSKLGLARWGSSWARHWVMELFKLELKMIQMTSAFFAADIDDRFEISLKKLEVIHFAAWEFGSEAECFYLRPVEPEVHLKQPKKQLHGAWELCVMLWIEWYCWWKKSCTIPCRSCIGLSRYFQDFIHSRCRISSINSIEGIAIFARWKPNIM